jgi:hypothetical protein
MIWQSGRAQKESGGRVASVACFLYFVQRPRRLREKLAA